MRLSNSSLSRFLAGSAVALVMASPAFADSQEELDEINLPTMSANTERTPQGQEEAVKPFEGDNLGNHIGTEKIQATRGMEITGGYSLAVSGGGSIYVTDGGDLRLQNGAITGLANPVNRDDASTKGYVDNRINGLKTGDDLGSHQAGKTLNMSNFKITNIAPPTAATDAADKSYVDTAIAGTGDDMGDHTATQTIDASNFEIINLGTATTPGSAVNKQYVDQAVTNGTSTSVDEARRINTGTGLTGGGDLSADRTISFSTSWGDARYARGTQTVNTGDGLTGGGSLGSNPTISVDGTVVRTSGAQTIGGKKTFTGDVNLSNRRLLGLANPTGGSDAATKSYVDTAIAGAPGVDNTVVRTFGDQSVGGVKTFTDDVYGKETFYADGFKASVTGFYGRKGDSTIAPTLSWIDDVHTGLYNPTKGQISFSSDRNEVFRIGGSEAKSMVPFDMSNNRITGLATPVDAGDAATKAYVDSRPSGGKADNLGDHTATRALNMNGQQIFGLQAPTAANHAVTKGYVDTAVSGVAGVDNTVVRTFGYQSIGGAKDFSDRIVTKGSSIYIDGPSNRHLWLRNSAGKNLGILYQEESTGMVKLRAYDNGAGTGVKSEIALLQDGRVVSSGIVQAPTFNATSTAGGGFQGIYADTEAQPTFTWSSDTNTGLFLKDQNVIGFTAAGRERMRLTTGGLDMLGSKVTGLADPTAGNHAATKSYVDSAVSGAGVDNTVVRTFGNQSIAGAKSFTNGVQVNVPAAPANTSANHLELRASSGGAADEVSVLFHNPGDWWAQIRARSDGFHFTDGGNSNYRDLYADQTMVRDGSAGSPAMSWSTDNNTGFFRSSENVIGFSAGGAERFRMTTSGIDMLNRKVTGLADPTAGTDAANKAYVDSAVSSVSGAGVDNTVVRTFGYQSIGGRKVFTDTIEANNGNIVLDGDANRLLWFRNSAGVAKGLVYSDETNKQMKMRLYDPAGSGSVVAQLALIQDGRTISQGKVEAPTFNATSTSEGGFQGIANDSAGRPSFTWTGDTNTGIYKPGSDIVGIATSGTERLRVSSSGTDVKGLKVLNVATPTSGSDAANKSYVDAKVAAVPAVDNTVVRTSGDQTVGGSKTFTSNLVTRGGSLYLDGSGSRHIWFRDTSGKNLGIIFQNNNTGTMHFRAYDDGAGTGTKAELQLRQDGKSTFSGTVEAPTFNATSTSGGGFQGIYADSEGQPTFTWSNDTNTGLFLKDQNVIGFTAAGRERMRMTTSGLDMLGRNITGLANPTGGKDAATKSYVDSAVSGAGVDNTVVRTFGNQSIGGTKTFSSTVVGPTFNATSTTGGGFQGIGGDSAGAPSFTWSGDTNTGMYRTSSDQLGFSTGGSQRLLLTNGQADFSVTPMFDTGNIILRSNGNRAIYFRNNGNSEQALIYHEENSNQLRFFLRNTANSSWVTSLVIDDGGSISPGGNGYFSGNGRGLTDLDANDISSGTVADARLPFRHAASGNTGAVTYNGQSKSNGVFYGGNSDPTSTSRRLNFDGYFAATRMYSNMYLYFSDERLKDDIAVMAQPMEKIRDLRPVTYTWKENGEKAMGLIAQEVEVVYPEIVRESGSGMKAVDYTQLISPMLAAIQELDARLTALETRE